MSTSQIFETNQPYANRIQWILNDEYTGPFTQNGAYGAFDPSRDLEIYVDGDIQTVQTFSFDSAHNRYLLYMDNSINLQGVVQIIHHIPNPPFVDANGTTLIGFALLASYSTSGDTTLSPTASLVAIANPTYASVPFYIVWNTTNVAEVEITGSNGTDPAIDSGRINTLGSGIYLVSAGVTVTTTFTLSCYDSNGNLLLTTSTQVVILPPPPIGFGMAFGGYFAS